MSRHKTSPSERRRRVELHLTQDLANAIALQATSSGVTKSNVVQLALDHYLYRDERIEADLANLTAQVTDARTELAAIQGLLTHHDRLLTRNIEFLLAIWFANRELLRDIHPEALDTLLSSLSEEAQAGARQDLARIRQEESLGAS
jgi:hypothetical protein